MILPVTVAYERDRSSSAAPRASGDAPSHLPANTRMPTVLGRGAAAYGRTREVMALVLWTLALFFALALASYQGDPSGSTGPAANQGAIQGKCEA